MEILWLSQKKFSLDRSFQRAIVHPKRSSYAKFMLWYHFMQGAVVKLYWSKWTSVATHLSTWLKTIVSQFGSFHSFSGPKLLGLFWCPKRHFLAIWGPNVCHGLDKNCSSWIDLSNRVSCTLNGVRMQKLRSREVDVSTNHLGPTHFMIVQLLGLGFWMFRVFSFMLMLKRPFGLFCNQLGTNEHSRHISSQR